MLNANRSSLITVLSGLVGGSCLSLVIGIVLLFAHGEQTFQLNSMPTAFATSPYQASTQKPISAQTVSMDAAESALNSGQPEKVRELLYPMIENWESNNDRIRGYKLLGEAELAQGHAQLAVPYFEKLYFYQPTAENLFTLAAVYDAGGDIKNALSKYQELAKWENIPQEIDIELIKMRIDHISRALGTPAPTQTPTQTPIP